MTVLWNDPRVQILASLLMAFVLGGIVGYERQYRQRTAGLRTNVLVAVGAALFVNMAAPRRPPEVLHLWPPKLLHPDRGDLTH
ncbi:hypothetical protein THICB3530008 [Thiomonas sp. CB3]|nr:hypothetical protein THICB3530008 [Thiomonas sp. CB3]